MKAAVLKSFGAPLDIQDLPDPVLGAGEVIVDMVAAGVASSLPMSSTGRATIRWNCRLFPDRVAWVGCEPQAPMRQS